MSRWRRKQTVIPIVRGPFDAPRPSRAFHITPSEWLIGVFVFLVTFGVGMGYATSAIPRWLGARAAERQAIELSARYSSCNEARSAGVAPIYSGEPGYSRDMDRDNDGVACEPYLDSHDYGNWRRRILRPWRW